MGTIFRVRHSSCSLPEVVGEDRQARPDSRARRALGQHATQAELAFKHTDRGFYAAAKPLQLPEPPLSLMRLFGLAQSTHFRDANFPNTGPSKLHHVIGTVVAPICGDFLGFYAEAGFRLPH